MRFAAATTVAGLAAVASAHWGNEHGHGPESYGWPQGSNATAPASYVTSVVTAYTTYCPSATEITHGASTYTVTEATTLTISDCPCTVTMPVYSSTASVCTTCSTSAVPPPVSYSSSTPVAPVTPSSTPVAPYPTYPAGNGTTPVAPTGGYSTSATSASASASSPVAYTGAAVAKAVPAGLLAVFGLVAAL